MSAPPTPIGIAVVEHEGRYLVGIRGEGSVLAGLAEFPGGKCEAGESPAECAVRECLEETGLAVKAVERLHACEHEYDHGPVALEFWLCRLCDAASADDVRSPFRWVPRRELGELRFPAANGVVVGMLVGR